MWRRCLLITLHWRHNERDGVSNHQHNDCLLNRLFERRSKKTSKLGVIGLCAGNSPATGEFPAQMASNADDDVIMRHPYCSKSQIRLYNILVNCTNVNISQQGLDAGFVCNVLDSTIGHHYLHVSIIRPGLFEMLIYLKWSHFGK